MPKRLSMSWIEQFGGFFSPSYRSHGLDNAFMAYAADADAVTDNDKIADRIRPLDQGIAQSRA
jgi:hypothetical protein